MFTFSYHTYKEKRDIIPIYDYYVLHNFLE